MNSFFTYLDDLASAQPELEWFARLTGVKLLVVGLQTASIIHAHHLSFLEKQNILLETRLLGGVLRGLAPL